MAEETVDPVLAAQKALREDAQRRATEAQAGLLALEEKHKVKFVPVLVLKYVGDRVIQEAGIQIEPR